VLPPSALFTVDSFPLLPNSFVGDFNRIRECFEPSKLLFEYNNILNLL
jgi:hypothetical protein